MCIVGIMEAPNRLTLPRRASSTISAIDLRRPESWTRSWFLTIDVDWAPDETMADTLELIQSYNVASTWMITHDSPMLDELRSAPNVELGIHPNFNGLLEGQDTRGFSNAKSVIEDLVVLVPEARAVRSHSVAQSSRLLDLCVESGLTHDVNMFIPSGSGNICSPWQSWNGMTRVPYVWEDDVWCLYEGTEQPEISPSDIVTNRPGIVVINFHPNHVYLNTESLDRSESVRNFHKNAEELHKHRYEGYGTRDRLIDLLQLNSDV